MSILGFDSDSAPSESGTRKALRQIWTILYYINFCSLTKVDCCIKLISLYFVTQLHTYVNFFQNSKSGEGKAKYDSGNVSWSQWGHSRTAEKGQKYGCSSDLYCGHVHSLPESQNYPWHFWSLLLRPCKWHFSLPVSILFGNPHLCLSFDVGCQFSLLRIELASEASKRELNIEYRNNKSRITLHTFELRSPTVIPKW